MPDGVAAVPVDLWDEGLASVPTARKVELALAKGRKTHDKREAA